MERLVRDEMMNHLLANNLISKDQHGFTQTQIMCYKFIGNN